MSDPQRKTLDAALRLAEHHGYRQITREMIALEAGVATGSVTNYLGTMKQMRQLIVKHAVDTGNKQVTAQAIVYADPYVFNHMTVDERIGVLRAVA